MIGNCVNEIQRRAASGEAFAQVLLGFLYQHGVLVTSEQDLELARDWYDRAAKQGYPEGQYALGLLLLHDDKEKGVCLLQAAANNEFAPAQAQLAILYMYGDKLSEGSVEPNPEYGLRLLNDAAESLYPPALVALGYVYCNGEFGVRRDIRVAIEYFRKAANMGDMRAKHALGSVLLTHCGEAQWREALHLLKECAESGHHASCMILGQIYGHGQHGVRRNYKLAQHYFALANNALSRN